MTDKMTVQIVETIKYTKTYSVEELAQMLNTSFEGMTQQEIASFVSGDERLEEDMQSNGDVWDTRWSVAPGDTYPGDTPMALAIDDGANPVAVVVYSMNEVYNIIRENYALDEDVADEDLIEHLQSQGVLIYLSGS